MIAEVMLERSTHMCGNSGQGKEEARQHWQCECSGVLTVAGEGDFGKEMQGQR